MTVVIRNLYINKHSYLLIVQTRKRMLFYLDSGIGSQKFCLTDYLDKNFVMIIVKKFDLSNFFSCGRGRICNVRLQIFNKKGEVRNA